MCVQGPEKHFLCILAHMLIFAHKCVVVLSLRETVFDPQSEVIKIFG